MTEQHVETLSDAELRAELIRLRAERDLYRRTLEAYEPPRPPLLPGETPEQYTDRLTGADKTGRVPYPEHRNRQCSINYHKECSDPDGERCKCPCHQFERLRLNALGWHHPHLRRGDD